MKLVADIEKRISEGATVAKATAAVGASSVNYYNWRKGLSDNKSGAKKSTKGSNTARSNVVHFSSGMPAGQILVAIGDAEQVQKTLQMLANR